jgi:hypothetical protein
VTGEPQIPDGWIVVEGDREKVERTRVYFREVVASMKNGLEAAGDLDSDITILRLQYETLRNAVRHVIADSPGTPEAVKDYLRKALDVCGEDGTPT